MTNPTIERCVCGRPIAHPDQEKLKQTVVELQQSNDELRQFAYAASHDLREPLGKIKAFGMRLDEKYSEQLDGKGREYIKVMRSAANRMMALIDDLLAYSKVGRSSTKFEPVDLNRVIEDVLSLLSERSAGAETHVDPNLPLVWGDPSQVYTLFQNLIGNSLKFKKPKEGARLWITAKTTDAHHIIALRDEGIGFDPKHLSRIFLIFERLHTRFDYPGTGIGLALCRRILERHGGFISAESVLGKGATFTIGFPRRSG